MRRAEFARRASAVKSRYPGRDAQPGRSLQRVRRAGGVLAREQPHRAAELRRAAGRLLGAPLPGPAPGPAGPGRDRFVVVEKRGTVQAVSGGAAATFLDIRSRVNSTPGEAGLLGLAFHPRWAQNRQVFVNYTAPSAASNANL